MTFSAHNNSNSCGVDTLQATNINSLRVISEPVAEVHSANHHCSPFLAIEEGEILEGVLNVCNVKLSDFMKPRIGHEIMYPHLHVSSCALQPGQ